MAREVVAASNNTPGAGEVIIDTGPVGAPVEKQMTIVVSASVLATFLIQQRNAANNANVWEMEVRADAGQTVVIPDMGYRLPYDSANDGDDFAERIRVVNKSAITLGVVSAAFLIA